MVFFVVREPFQFLLRNRLLANFLELYWQVKVEQSQRTINVDLDVQKVWTNYLITGPTLWSAELIILLEIKIRG